MRQASAVSAALSIATNVLNLLGATISWELASMAIPYYVYQWIAFGNVTGNYNAVLGAFTSALVPKWGLARAGVFAFVLTSSGCFVSEGVYVMSRSRADTSISESDIRVIKEVSAEVANEFGMLPTPASKVETQETHFRSVLKGGWIIASAFSGRLFSSHTITYGFEVDESLPVKNY